MSVGAHNQVKNVVRGSWSGEDVGSKLCLFIIPSVVAKVDQ